MKMKIFDFFMISMIEIKIVVPVIGCRQTCYEIASKTGWVHFENNSRCARAPSVRANSIFL